MYLARLWKAAGFFSGELHFELTPTKIDEFLPCSPFPISISPTCAGRKWQSGRSRSQRPEGIIC